MTKEKIPTWDECKRAVDAGCATPLQTLIYEYEPSLTPEVKALVDKCIPLAARRADSQFRTLLASALGNDLPSRASQEVQASGRLVGETLYWDIEGESIADADLRRWCWMNLPEPWNSCAGGIVNYHVAAYKHRREALKEYLR